MKTLFYVSLSHTYFIINSPSLYLSELQTLIKLFKLLTVRKTVADSIIVQLLTIETATCSGSQYY